MVWLYFEVLLLFLVYLESAPNFDYAEHKGRISRSTVVIAWYLTIHYRVDDGWVLQTTCTACFGQHRSRGFVERRLTFSLQGQSCSKVVANIQICICIGKIFLVHGRRRLSYAGAMDWFSASLPVLKLQELLVCAL